MPCRRAQWLSLAALFVGLLILADRLWPVDLESRSFATVVTAENGLPLRRFADAEGVWRYRVSLDDVSPYYLEALLGYEDRWYFYHPGVNPVALVRAVYDWIVQGRIISGGSTLTMQVVRLRYQYSGEGDRDRSITGKLKQIVRAFQLERRFSKREILTYYINHAPFGGTIEGVEAASLSYFGYPSKSLTRAQAALLAVLPQAPSRFRPDRYPENARSARDKLLDRLANFGVWDADVINDCKLENIVADSDEFHTLAPLLARRLRSGVAQPVIRTFINYDLQMTLGSLVRDHARSVGERVSAAVLVMENDTGRVIGYSGSPDFHDMQRFGHVDMVRAIRSPGSAYKPFIYGLALDDGFIHSESLLHDVPLQFGDYMPENFQRRFSGAVSASEALQASLNIAAVQLLDGVGSEKFYARMVNANLEVRLPSHARPNLSMALGGFGSNLESLVSAFSAIGNGGVATQPRYTGSQIVVHHTLLSEGSAWIVQQMLRDAKQRLPIATKTGTSYGNRDIWAVGVSSTHTVGVWVGRPDNVPVPGHYGSRTALPLVSGVFSLLPLAIAETVQPASVQQKEICWPGGKANAANCDIRRTAWVLDGTVPATLMSPGSAFNLPIQELNLKIADDSGLRVPMGCSVHAAGRDVTLWPESLDPWVFSDWRRDVRIPAVDPRCASVDGFSGRSAIRIEGITDGHRFHRHQASTTLPTVTLEARGAARPWYWFVNGTLQSSETVSMDMTPEDMQYQIVLLDQLGNNAALSFYSDR